MRVIIVEDDFIVADHLKLMLEKQGITVCGIIDNYQEAIDSLDLKVDFYFVDIRLASIKSGIDLGCELSKSGIPFIYLTANNEIDTLKRATETKPFGYITKPYKISDILALIEIYKSRFPAGVEVRSDLGKKVIPTAEILFFEADGSYLNIVTTETTYSERTTLTEIEKQYGSIFLRTHRSYLINPEKVDQYNSHHIYIENYSIPISRTHKGEVMAYFNKSKV